MTNSPIYDDNTFEVVPFSEWRVSFDGYYYLRPTKALDYMQKGTIKGRTSISWTMSAPLLQGGLGYQSNAGKVDVSGNKKHLRRDAF